MPKLHRANVETVEVWGLVANQHVMSFGGPVDIDVNAVLKVMDLLGTKEREWVLRRIKKLHNKFMAEDAEKRKDKE